MFDLAECDVQCQLRQFKTSPKKICKVSYRERGFLLEKFELVYSEEERFGFVVVSFGSWMGSTLAWVDFCGFNLFGKTKLSSSIIRAILIS